MVVVPDVVHDQARFFPGAEHRAPGARDLVHRYVVDEGGIQGQLRRALGACGDEQVKSAIVRVDTESAPPTRLPRPILALQSGPDARPLCFA